MTPLRYSRQALADALQAWVAMDANGHWQAWNIRPTPTKYGDWIDLDYKHGMCPLIASLFQITDPPTDWRESLTAPRTESEPEVCEWRRTSKAWMYISCEQDERAYRSDPDYTCCPYCCRPIRIVEGAEHG